MNYRRAAHLVLLAVVASACASAHDNARSASPTHAAPRSSGVAGIHASSTSLNALNDATTSSSIPTTSTLPAADYAFDDVTPQPAHSPSNPRENVRVQQIGTIRIPKIGLVHPIYEGVWLTVIDQGPGHWPGAALPGERGNAVFPGHRVTHSHPFLNLDQLSPGDEIIFEMNNGTFTYRVREKLIVTPQDIWVVDQHSKFESTLIACHPKHSARQRIVIKSDLVKSELNDQGKREQRAIGDGIAASAV